MEEASIIIKDEESQEKQILYMLVSQDKKILCEYYKKRGPYLNFIETVLKETQIGKSVLLYKE